MKIPTRSLGEVKATLRAKVDTEAEAARLQFVTPGDAQMMVYLTKEGEARAYLADPSIDPASILHLTREAAAMGVTVADQAALIVSMAEQWRDASSRIEAARLSAKAAIDAAPDYASASAAAAVDWPAVLTA